MWKGVSKVRDKSKCKCEVGVEGVWGDERSAGSGKGVKHVIVEGVEFQCHVFPFPVYVCVFVCVVVCGRAVDKGDFMTVKANKLNHKI